GDRVDVQPVLLRTAGGSRPRRRRRRGVHHDTRERLLPRDLLHGDLTCLRRPVLSANSSACRRPQRDAPVPAVLPAQGFTTAGWAASRRSRSSPRTTRSTFPSTISPTTWPPAASAFSAGTPASAASRAAFCLTTRWWTSGWACGGCARRRESKLLCC